MRYVLFTSSQRNARRRESLASSSTEHLLYIPVRMYACTTAVLLLVRKHSLFILVVRLGPLYPVQQYVYTGCVHMPAHWTRPVHWWFRRRGPSPHRLVRGPRWRRPAGGSGGTFLGDLVSLAKTYLVRRFWTFYR